MYLVQIFRASPLMGLALCICLTTILWCFLMAKRQQLGLDKILTGVLGLIAVYEAIRVLKDAGVILFPGIQRLDGWVDFNCLDVSSPSAQSRRDVVAGSSAHNRDVRQCGMGFIREVIVSANLAPSSALNVREIVNALIVVACGVNQRQARILTAPNFQ